MSRGPQPGFGIPILRLSSVFPGVPSLVNHRKPRLYLHALVAWALSRPSELMSLNYPLQPFPTVVEARLRRLSSAAVRLYAVCSASSIYPHVLIGVSSAHAVRHDPFQCFTPGGASQRSLLYAGA